MGETTAKNLSDVPPAKPGYLTTEFWKSNIVSVIGLLVATGIISPDATDKYNQWVQVAAILATALSVGAYSLSRGKTKAAAVEAAASVVATNAHLKFQRELNFGTGVTMPSAPVADEAQPGS